MLKINKNKIILQIDLLLKNKTNSSASPGAANG